MITILGATATGKTELATNVSYHIDAEIISADSRQVYQGMDIGTGKDIESYQVKGKTIPYHLIDIVKAGTEYNIYNYQQDFLKAYQSIQKKEKPTVFCGGSGLYLEAIILGYDLAPVPENTALRTACENQSIEALQKELKTLQPNLHNTTDLQDRNRLIRALEIAYHKKNYPQSHPPFPKIENTIFGVHFERSVIRKRITERLQQRLESHQLINEVEHLLSQGVSEDMLKFYGLEYRYVTDYISGNLTYDEMFRQLNTAIHQFAKRQMTWFQRMEKKGITINWINGTLSLEDKVNFVRSKIKNEPFADIF